MSKHTVYQGRRYRVEAVTFPDYPGHEYQIVRHPGSAVILPLLNEDEVVVIHNWRAALEREIVELPAGTLEPGEDPVECAKRELTEETGYSAGRMEPLAEMWPSPGICDEKMRLFVARDLTEGRTNFDEGERIRVAVMRFDDVLVAIANGQIQDAKTMVAMLMYDAQRRERS
ncbi:MAG: NUDIX hydrolase [Phycisphaerales bacterium]|nr:NUDIX hydrolase [Phycisphaerales bacterium]